MILVMQGDGARLSGLARGLEAEGMNVTIDRGTDLNSMQKVRAAVAEVRPEAVLLTAQWDDLEGCEADEARAFTRNAEPAINVAAAALEFGCLPVLLSSADVFGGSGGPWSEADPPQPLSTWARSRLKGEQFLLRAAKHGLVVRTGPVLEDGLVDLAGRLSGDVVEADDELVSPIGAVDLGRAVAALVEARAGGVVHVANGGAPVSRADLLRAAARALGLDPERVRGAAGRSLPQHELRPRSPTLHTDRLAKVLKAPLRPWSAALEEAAGASIERVPAPEEHTGAGLRAGPRAEVEIFTPHPVATAYGTRLNLANGKEHCARLITLDAGKQVALRKYTRAERTFHVLEGKVVLELPDQEDEDHVLRPGRSVTMPPHVRYRMSAVGAARVLVIWAGADDDDVEA
ncbi:MAG: sugar nucleotide-binding protein [Deltaproteobacteria bacterium]|nr:sugar nucleotide-binding protein [Deltaproteobacteria bacterium]